MKKALFLFVCFLLCYGIVTADVITGIISSNLTMNHHDVNILSGDVTIAPGVTLTMDWASTLYFDTNARLIVKGNINAVGNADWPVRFKPHNPNDNNGISIVFQEGGTGSFNYCDFENGRQGAGMMIFDSSGTVSFNQCNIAGSAGNALTITSGTVNLENTNISGVSGDAISLSGSSSVLKLIDVSINGCQSGINVNLLNPTLHSNSRNISITNARSYPIAAYIKHYNNIQSLSVINASQNLLQVKDLGNINDSYTLRNFNIPYFLTYSIAVDNSATLALNPGVVLRFNQWQSMTIKNGGKLEAEGTDASPISFAASGDTHWGSIIFEGGSKGSLDYCNISGGGYSQYNYLIPVISIYKGFDTISISNSTINGGNNHGIAATYNNADSNNNALSLNNVTIQGCPGAGLYIGNEDLNLCYTNLTIKNSAKGLDMPANLLDQLTSGINLINNTNNAIYINNGSIKHDLTIPNIGYPYVCEGTTLTNGSNEVNLVIAAGCEFYFGHNKGIEMGYYAPATITAVGTAEAPIKFKRLPSSSQNWRGISLSGSASSASFEYCILDGAACPNPDNQLNQPAFTLDQAHDVSIQNTQILNSDTGAIRLGNNGGLMLRNVLIDGCNKDAFYQQSSSFSVDIEGLEIKNCNAYPISISAAWTHKLSGLTLTNNTHNLIRLNSGGNFATQILINYGYPYLVSGYDVTVHSSTLTLEPGTKLYFEEGRSLRVTRSPDIPSFLIANGTLEEPIIFSRPSGANYYWQSIIVENNCSATFSHCQFNHGGKRSQYGHDLAFIQNNGANYLSVTNCQISDSDARGIACTSMEAGDVVVLNQVQINGCLTDGLYLGTGNYSFGAIGINIQNCARYPIVIPAMYADPIQELSLSNNVNNYIRIAGSGNLGGIYSFPNFGYPYRCEVDITGNQDSVLSFPAGCEFQMADGKHIAFNGAMSANGTEEQPVIFRGLNAEMSSSWGGLRFNHLGKSSVLYHTIIQNAGCLEQYVTAENSSALYLGNGTLSLMNCELKKGSYNLIIQAGDSILNLERCKLHGGSNGIKHIGGTLSVKKCEITMCTENAIYHNAGTLNFGISLSEWNKIYANNCNLYNNTSSAVNAPYCYWGSIQSVVIESKLHGDVNYSPWLDLNCLTEYTESGDVTSHSFPEGEAMPMGDDENTVYIIMEGGSADLVEDGDIPPFNNNSFDPAQEFVLELMGGGPWSITILTDLPWGAYHRGGKWTAVQAEGNSIVFDIDAAKSGGMELPIVLGDRDPTLPVTLSSFTAVLTADMQVKIAWVVESETDHAGYNLLRSEVDKLDTAIRINSDLITEGIANGTQIAYQYTDSEVYPASTYFYWLESQSLNGETEYYGPLQVQILAQDEEQELPVIPFETKLYSAFPNPFNPATNLRYSMKEAGEAVIQIYNLKGQLLQTYHNRHDAPGYYQLSWDGRDAQGKPLSTGVYFYRMISGKYSATKKMVLSK